MKISDSLLGRMEEVLSAPDGDDPDGEIGAIIGGRYRLVRLLGAGGMGRVFEAEDASFGRVAIKLLSTCGAAAQARFAREAMFLKDLSHPRIVRLLDHGLHAGPTPYVVTELYDGETLAARLARGPLGVPDALRVVALICEPLSMLHDRGVIHRDLKPSNVFFRAQGGDPGGVEGLVLLDFGLARALEDDEDLTYAGSTLGTPGYIAPELALGAKPDPRADVFALGSLLAACLGDDAPAASVALASRMRSLDPSHRPRDARVVLRELDDVAREGTSSTTDGAVPDWAAIEAALESTDPGVRALGGELAERWFDAAGIFDAAGADDLARRLEAAGIPARATVWYRRAARLSYQQNDFAGLADRVLASIRCGASDAEVGGLHLLLAQANGWENRPREAIHHAETAMKLLGEGSVAWVRAATEVGVASSRIGAPDRIETIATLVGRSLDGNAPRWVLISAARLVTALSVAGRAAGARALCDRLHLLAEGLPTHDALVEARVFLARSVCALFEGDLEAHVALLERSVALTSQAGDMRSNLHDRANLGFALVALGEIVRAEPLIEATLREAEACGLRFIATLSKKNLATLRLEQGRHEEAARLASEAAHEASANPRLASAALAYEAFAAVDGGDLDRAERAATSAFACAPGDMERARALGAMLEVDVARADTRAATERARTMEALLAEVPAIDGGEARVWLALVGALRLVGDDTGAERALRAGQARVSARVHRIKDPKIRDEFSRLRDHVRLAVAGGRFS